MEKKRAWFHLLSIGETLFALGGSYFDYETMRLGERYSIADVEEFVEETGNWKPAKSLDGKRGSYGGVAVTRDLVCG